jgi:hypothetical protein
MLFFKGLRETEHPFAFVAQTGFRDLLETDNSFQKAVQVLPRLVAPLKNALVDSDDNVFEASLNALVQLSNATGPYLNPHLKVFLSIVSGLQVIFYK